MAVNECTRGIEKVKTKVQNENNQNINNLKLQIMR